MDRVSIKQIYSQEDNNNFCQKSDFIKRLIIAPPRALYNVNYIEGDDHWLEPKLFIIRSLGNVPIDSFHLFINAYEQEITTMPVLRYAKIRSDIFNEEYTASKSMLKLESLLQFRMNRLKLLSYDVILGKLVDLFRYCSISSSTSIFEDFEWNPPCVPNENVYIHASLESASGTIKSWDNRDIKICVLLSEITRLLSSYQHLVPLENQEYVERYDISPYRLSRLIFDEQISLLEE